MARKTANPTRQAAGAPPQRSRLDRNRRAFRVARDLEALTAADLHTLIEADLEGLPLNDKGRDKLRRFLRLGKLPTDQLFWDVLDETQRWISRTQPLTHAAVRQHLRAIYRSGSRREMPRSCLLAGTRVLTVLANLKSTGGELLQASYNGRLFDFRTPFGVRFLVDLVRDDGVVHPRVRDGITWWRANLADGTPAEKRKARKVLRRVGDALASVGRGRLVERTVTERQQKQREAVQRSDAVKRCLTRYIRCREAGDSPKIAEAEAERCLRLQGHVRATIVTSFRKKARLWHSERGNT